jgi:prepilin-type N-terminal cleavage/methylation domain-containing protein
MATPRGFTLVEVMVAMVIGMIGIIIMMQVFASAEGQKRTTTGTGDAQSNGAMAIYTLQRDIREAGYGFNAMNALGCPLALPAPASRTLTQLAPVIINPLTAAGVPEVPAGDDNTDTLLVAYGNGEGSPEGDVITAIPSATVIGVQTAASFSVGSQVIAAPSGPTAGCSLTLARVVSIAAPNLTTEVASGAIDGGTLFNLGTIPRIRAYAVRGGNLTFCDYINELGNTVDCSLAANYVAIANNIVSLRAQYGRDTDRSSECHRHLGPGPTVTGSGKCRDSRLSLGQSLGAAYRGRRAQQPVRPGRGSPELVAGLGRSRRRYCAAINLSRLQRIRDRGRITATRSSRPSYRFATWAGWQHVRSPKAQTYTDTSACLQRPAKRARSRPARGADHPRGADARRGGADSLGRYRQHHCRQPVVPRIGSAHRRTEALRPR